MVTTAPVFVFSESGESLWCLVQHPLLPLSLSFSAQDTKIASYAFCLEYTVLDNKILCGIFLLFIHRGSSACRSLPKPPAV